MSDPHPLRSELTAYIDGELSTLDEARIKQALQSDPALAALEIRLRAAVSATRQLPAPEASAQLRRAVLTRISERPSWLEQLKGLLAQPYLAPAAGAALAVAVVVAVSTRSTEAPRPDELQVAMNLEVLEDFDVAGLSSAEDVEVVAALHELEVTP